MSRDNTDLEHLVETQLVRVNAAFSAVVVGLLAGLGLFMATNWLLLKAGSPGEVGADVVVGPHLALLGQYFIGYRVSFVGSLIGFAYAFVCAGVIAYAGSWLYNWVAGLRHGRST